MATVAIDCRYLGSSGIGRHIEGILDYLDYEKDDFLLIGKKEVLDKTNYPARRIYCESHPFSVSGLKDFPVKEVNECDYFYTPNFIIPFGIKTRILSTLHDVVFLEYKECCNGFADKLVKKLMIKRAMKKSEKIFTVSEFSKKRILHFFPGCKKEIKVIYNGVSKSFVGFDTSSCEKSDYFIYVGNIKKHKGLNTLLSAYEKMKASGCNIKLYVLGSEENFRTSDAETADKIKKSDICFTGYKTGDELMKFIAGAKALIQPSLYEGFGLPPLEALYLKTKPVISDIEVFREIYSETDAVFFRTLDPDDLCEKLVNINPEVDLTKNAPAFVKFNFKSVAQKVQEEFI